jgi:hypothetical protein
MENYEELLVGYFTEQNQKSREKAIIALEQRDFKTLINSSWSIRTEVEEVIKHRDVRKVIDQLQTALKNVKPNQTVPTIHTHIEQEEEQWATETVIYLKSYLYSIKPIETCNSSAIHCAKSAMWKIENQPNGNDTKRYLEIIDKINI